MNQNDYLAYNLSLLKDLPPKASYFLGVLHAKTGLQLHILSEFLLKVYRSPIPSPEQLCWVEEKLAEGKLGEIQEKLQSFHKPSLNQDILDLIQNMKNSEFYKKKYKIKPEENCFICGNSKFANEVIILASCKHSFHKGCLVDETEYLLNNEVSIIRCPSCSDVMRLCDLIKFLPPLLLQTYERISYLNVSKTEQKIQCSNIYCQCIFVLRKKERVCRDCGTEINIQII